MHPGGTTEEDVPLRLLLADTLKITIDWVKFSEAKNAALIGFNVAAIVGIERISDHLWLWYKILVLLFLALSAIVALSSVIPRVGWPIGARGYGTDISHFNLLFYGDVGRLSVDDYLAALENLVNRPLSQTERWLAAQVAVISRITLA